MRPQPLTSPRRKATFALGVGAAVVVLAAMWAVGISAADPNVAAVQELAVDTIRIEHTVFVPAVAAGAVVPALEADRLRAIADDLARSHYVGPLLDRRLAVFRQAIDDQLGGTAAFLDGGVKDVVVQSTTIRADSATVKLRATTWMKVSQGDATATPTGTADYTFQLAKVGGSWFVISEEFEYLPGQGP